MSANTSSTQTTQTTYVGRCKWFSSDHGYGFLVVMNGDHKDRDIFVHYSDLAPQKDVMKTLYSGEYVEFQFGVGENGKEKATDVTGVCGGPLQCEERQSFRKSRKPKNDGESSEASVEVEQPSEGGDEHGV